ncbi:hypothetical protein EDB81DRAFT_667323 [Dactylonectria macrodidyma]|uniref:Uncharacterized protein n=2 Tax=Dactylonectria TaxID=1620264 RepID=A0A9P9DHA9_9HYPO|nr:hypothetical protein B0J13DRAFT_458645 [Dactylonectria estremocensis]KAH7119168.1 hypothetical protein EDB81DRAFT_667323 [Dactylonectria macrodidyma]
MWLEIKLESRREGFAGCETGKLLGSEKAPRHLTAELPCRNRYLEEETRPLLIRRNET